MRWLSTLFLVSCSLGPRPEVCDIDATCRDAFGLGWSCGEAGFCEEPAPNARCDSSWPTDLLTRPEKYGDAIVIGSLFDRLTDLPQTRSAELAVRQASENGGLDGRTIGIVHCGYEEDNTIDDLDNEAAARSTARYLVDVLGAQVLVGPATSDQATIVYDEVSADGVLIISPSATSPLLTTIDGETSTDEDPGLFWRTAPPDDVQGAAIAADLLARGRTHVAVINKTGAYGTALADVITAEIDPSIQLDRFEFTNATELTEALVDAVADPAVQEVVFLSGDVEDLISFLNGAVTQSRFKPPVPAPDPEPDPLLDPLEIFFADGGADPYLLDQTANAEDLYPQVRGTRPQVPVGPVYQTFQVAYSAEFDGEDPAPAVYASFSFDAAWLALYGTAWATYQEPKVDGVGIARGLRQISDGSTPLPVRSSSWDDVLASFLEGSSLDLDGASGPLDFDPVSGETAVPIEYYYIEGDEFVVEEGVYVPE